HPDQGRDEALVHHRARRDTRQADRLRGPCRECRRALDRLLAVGGRLTSPHMPSFSTPLRTELARLLAPLANATGSADRWNVILALVGREVNGDAGLKTALDALGGLAKLGDGVEDGWGGIEAVLTASGNALGALDQIEHAASNGSFVNLGEDL